MTVIRAMERHFKGGKLLFTGFARMARVPNLIVVAITQYMVALFLVNPHAVWKSYVYDWRLLLLAVSTTIIAAAGYLINDYYDIKIDLINKPERVVAGKLIRRRIVMFAHTALNFTGIAIGLFLSWKIGLIHFLSAFLLWLYSNQLKRMPLIGNLVIALLSGLSVGVVSVLYNDYNLLVAIYAVFAFAISIIREIIKDMEDLQGDEVFGCRTLPIIWGIRKTKLLLYVLIGGFIFLLFFLSGMIGNITLTVYFSILILPLVFFIIRLVYADTKREFGFLSDFCKVLMLSGVLSMIFFK